MQQTDQPVQNVSLLIAIVKGIVLLAAFGQLHPISLLRLLDQCLPIRQTQEILGERYSAAKFIDPIMDVSYHYVLAVWARYVGGRDKAPMMIKKGQIEVRGIPSHGVDVRRLLATGSKEFKQFSSNRLWRPTLRFIAALV